MQQCRYSLCYVCVCVYQGCCIPVVSSEGGSQCDARLSFLQAGWRVHAARAAGAGVWWKSSGLIVLKETGNTHSSHMNNYIT